MNKLTTACRIRPKSINEKNLPSIIHEFEGRVYVEKEKISYRYDVVEQNGKKSEGEIVSLAKKLVLNCIYESSYSLILSMGTSDSGYREMLREEKGLFESCLGEIFRVK